MSTIPSFELNDGNRILQLGFGVAQIPLRETAESVLTALEVGYRHLDTAHMYLNERGVGEALQASAVPRAELFLTGKLDNPHHRPDDARRAFEETLSDLGVEYLDLYLIHWPLPTLYDGDFVSTWKTLEEFKEDGRARSIGVSNFQIDHLRRLARETETVPAVNQIEMHPYLFNEAVRVYGAEHRTATAAWSPLGRGAVLGDSTIGAIGQKYGKSIAQVILRWHIQLGNIVVPKSATPSRMRENFEVFDFELAPEDMDAITALDRGEEGRTGPHPDTFATLVVNQPAT
jgi:2,5-diketo-D-gluconate reductase A